MYEDNMKYYLEQIISLPQVPLSTCYMYDKIVC